MGKYINKTKVSIIVLRKRYKPGKTFTLTAEEESRVSPLFLNQYRVSGKPVHAKEKELETGKETGKEEDDQDNNTHKDKK